MQFKIYIAFYNPSNPKLYETLIRLSTKSNFVHCQFFVLQEDKAIIFGALPGRGFVKEEIDLDEFGSYINSPEWDFIKLDLEYSDLVQRSSKFKYKKYGYLKAISSRMPYTITSNKKVFCSEYCYNILYNLKDGAFITPSLLKILLTKEKNK